MTTHQVRCGIVMTASALIASASAATGLPARAADGGPAVPVPIVRVLAGEAQRCIDPALPVRDRPICPQGLAVDPAGGLLIADTGTHRIRRLAPTGQITAVVGRGADGFCGDGGPALQACLSSPTAVAADPGTGDLLIADNGNARIRRVDRDTGRISTVAGRSCPRPDPLFQTPADRAALDACLGHLTALVADGQGGVYLAEIHRVRRLHPAGTIRTVAGSDSCTEPASLLDARQIGDGGPAAAACLGHVQGIAATPDGGLLIADAGHNRLRAVDPSGTIRTLAGNGLAAGDTAPSLCLDTCVPPCPAEGPARTVCLPHPVGVAVRPDGTVFIAGIGGPSIGPAGHPSELFLGPAGIWRLGADGVLTLVVGNPYLDCGYGGHPERVDGFPGRLACLDGITGPALDPSGQLVFISASNQVAAIQPAL